MKPTWTFFTNYTHVLVSLDRNPDISIRQMALDIGITERAVQRILSDLCAAGVLEKAKVGRKNSYSIHQEHPLHHPLEGHRSIGQILAVISKESLP